MAEVLWGKVEGNPWWPCHVEKHNTKVHGPLPKGVGAKQKGAKFVVFYDTTKSKTWAWLKPSMAKPFAAHLDELSKKSKTARFRAAVSLANKQLPGQPGQSGQEKGKGKVASKRQSKRKEETPRTAVETSANSNNSDNGGGEASEDGMDGISS